MASRMDLALDKQRSHAELSEHEADRATPRNDHRRANGFLLPSQRLQLLNECRQLVSADVFASVGLERNSFLMVCVRMRGSKRPLWVKFMRRRFVSATAG